MGLGRVADGARQPEAPSAIWSAAWLRRESQKLAAAQRRALALQARASPRCFSHLLCPYNSLIHHLTAVNRAGVPGNCRLYKTTRLPASSPLHLPQPTTTTTCTTSTHHSHTLSRDTRQAPKHTVLQAQEVALQKCPSARDTATRHGLRYAARPRKGRRESNVRRSRSRALTCPLADPYSDGPTSRPESTRSCTACETAWT